MEKQPEPFAVDLSNDGIFLWHRKPAKKWEFLGSVPLSSGNLRQQLETLKNIAMDIDAPSNDAVVRIPTAEVNTLTVPHDPDADTSWEIRIVSAIEAAAGVSIRTIAFDIDRGNNSSDISIAWTPMEVIKQAETFVHLIGFIPTRYTTDVNTTNFPRSPYFQLADYHTQSEDVSNNGNASDAQDTPDTDSLAIPPQTYTAAPQFQQTKSGFGFIWFIALFIILAMLLAGLYFWPRLQQSAILETDLKINQPFFAIVNSVSAIGFEKNKTIL